MASVFNHTKIMPAILSLLLVIQHTTAFSTSLPDDDEEYGVVSTFMFKGGARFLHKAEKISRGAHCDPIKNNICNRLSVNKGTGILDCCKTHCRDVLRDRNNCGKCGGKCGFGQICCHGICTRIGDDIHHCGKCDNKCLPGVKCEYGICGYA